MVVPRRSSVTSLRNHIRRTAEFRSSTTDTRRRHRPRPSMAPSRQGTDPSSRVAIRNPRKTTAKENLTMRCPYCGVHQTEVLRTVCRRHKTYRYRKCVFCKARFRTQEKPVRWEGVDRKWPGTPPARKRWRNHRISALRENCEVQSCGVGFKQSGSRRHVDHIVPARLIRRFAGRQSRPPGKSSVHLRSLPWVQAPGRS